MISPSSDAEYRWDRPASTGPGDLGLFTTRAFAAGALITGFDGLVFSGYRAAHRVASAAKSLAQRRAVARFRVLDAHVRWVVGCSDPNPPVGIGGASYANDGRRHTKNNSLFVVRTAPGAPHMNL